MFDHIRQCLGGSEKGMFISPIIANASSPSTHHTGMVSLWNGWLKLTVVCAALDNQVTTKGSKVATMAATPVLYLGRACSVVPGIDTYTRGVQTHTWGVVRSARTFPV